MNSYETRSPSLFERCFAAVFSGMAAGITYAIWVFYHSGSWGAEQIAEFKGIGIWVVLGGAVLGFLGGISLVTWLWGEIWETRTEALISMRTAIVLLCLVSIGYWLFVA